MVNAYKDRKIQENTRGYSGGLEYAECVQHFGWEMFEMAIWKTEEIGAYYNENKCHMTDRWPCK